MFIKKVMKSISFIMPFSWLNVCCDILIVHEVIHSIQMNLVIILLHLSVETAIGFVFFFKRNENIGTIYSKYIKSIILPDGNSLENA